MSASERRQVPRDPEIPVGMLPCPIAGCQDGMFEDGGYCYNPAHNRGDPRAVSAPSEKLPEDYDLGAVTDEAAGVSAPDARGGMPSDSQYKARDCDRCGQPKYMHTDVQLFCPFISTYRASIAPQEPVVCPFCGALPCARLDECDSYHARLAPLAPPASVRDTLEE